MGEISTVTLLDGVTYDIKDAKSRMAILKYGSSTWTDFITAYDNKAIVYCRASSNSNPGTGSQTRLAFMAYVNNETTPTEVEFQYYRSVSSHSDSQQGDQVYVYKLNKTTGWSVTTRNAFTKVIAGTGLTSSFTTGTSSTITLALDTINASTVVYDNTASGLSSTSVQGAIDEVASDIDKSNAVFINFSATGHFLDEEYETTDGWWTFDSITDADGNSLTYTDLFSAFQDGKNIFLNATPTIQNNTYYYKNIPMSGVDAEVDDPSTSYKLSFDFVDNTLVDYQSTWRVWVDISNNLDPSIYQINVDKSDADNIRYSNTISGLTATDVQGAIDELKSDIPTAASDISYDSTISYLSASNVQAAIDEVDSNIESVASDLANLDASDISYDNTSSGLAATDVQAAIDEIAPYDGTVTDISTGTGLEGGPITTSGTISHSDYGSAGTAGTSSATSGKTLSVPYITTNAQGHVTAKGTHTHTVTGFADPTVAIFKSTTSEVDVANSTSTFTAIDNISAYDGLTKGYWLIQATVNFSANATGYRVVVLSQNTSISGANNWGTVIVGASPFDVTRVQVMALMNVTSTTTPIHVFAKQNSGSTRKVVATMRAFRLG